jgi:hypothetical protein
MEPEGSSPHSQTHATCPYPELAPSSPHTHISLPLLVSQKVVTGIYTHGKIEIKKNLNKNENLFVNNYGCWQGYIKLTPLSVLFTNSDILCK